MRGASVRTCVSTSNWVTTGAFSIEPGQTSRSSPPILTLSQLWPEIRAGEGMPSTVCAQKGAARCEDRPCLNTQPVIDFFQRQGLLLAVAPTTREGPGRRIPGIEPRVGEFARRQVL